MAQNSRIHCFSILQAMIVALLGKKFHSIKSHETYYQIDGPSKTEPSFKTVHLSQSFHVRSYLGNQSVPRSC